jgi:hypothetical protein
LRNVIDDLVDHVGRVKLLIGRAPTARLRDVTEDLLHRPKALRRRLRASRLGRSADGIIVVPLLAVVLVLGVFTANAATHESSDDVDADLALARLGDNVGADVVTQTERQVVTVRRPGKRNVVTVERTQKRVVQGPRGVSTVFASVTVPGEAKTVTVTGPSQTVTQVLTETVTTVVTVTEKKKP